MLCVQWVIGHLFLFLLSKISISTLENIIFLFLFLLSKLEIRISNFSFYSRNSRSEFQISLSTLEITFLTLVNAATDVAKEEDNRHPVNIMVLDNLCKICQLMLQLAQLPLPRRSQVWHHRFGEAGRVELVLRIGGC